MALLVCVSSVILFIASAQAQLVLIQTPSFNTEPDPELTAVVGKSVIIQATSDDTIQWFFNDVPIENDERHLIHATNYRLKIINVSFEDAGRYKAVLTSAFSQTIFVETVLVVKADCGTPNAPLHGYAIVSDGPYEDNDVVYFCWGGYSLEGDTSATCQHNGSWDAVETECINLEVIMNRKFDEIRVIYDQYIRDLLAKIEALETENQNQQVTINSNQATMQSQQTILSQTQQQVTIIRTDLDEQTGNVAVLQSSDSATQNTISQMVTNMTILSNQPTSNGVESEELADIRNTLTAIQNNVTEMRSMTEALGNEDVASTGVDVDTELARLEQQITQLENSRTSFESEIRGSIADIEASQSSSDVQTSIAQLQQMIADVRSDYESDHAITEEKLLNITTLIDETTQSLGQHLSEYASEIINVHTGIAEVNYTAQYALQQVYANSEMLMKIWMMYMAGNVGQISTPMHPLNYPEDFNTTFTISVNTGVGIEILFESFDVEGTSSCAFDYLEVYDGPSDSSPLLERMCGYYEPGYTLNSTSTIVFMRFLSDPSVTAPGFKLFYRPILSRVINLCDDDPCYHDSACIPYEDGYIGYTCDCTEGYEGTACDSNIDDCINHECVNGQCVDGLASYTCFCMDGYTGWDCSEDIDECLSTPCQNGAECTDLVNAVSCECLSGYTGVFCDSLVDSCDSNPCQNGAACESNMLSYSCGCTPGYSGTNCDVFDGIIDFPEGDGYYANDVVHIVQISVTSGYVIKITFLDIHIESSSEVCPDWVEIFDGTLYDDSLGFYCGSAVPDTIVTSSNTATIEFRSDYSVRGRGYTLRYEETWPDIPAIQYGNCYTAAANGGDYALCQRGYIVCAVCASTYYAMCEFGSMLVSSMVYCCPLYNYDGTRYSDYEVDTGIIANDGYAMTCADDAALNELCGSDYYRECRLQYYYSFWSAAYQTVFGSSQDNIFYCHHLNGGRSINYNTCVVLYGTTYDKNLYCPAQYTVVGFCGSHYGNECNGASHAIKCCEVQ